MKPGAYLDKFALSPSVFSALDGLLWLCLALITLVFFQRAFHREIQAVFLILTRHPVVTQVIFALIFLPGIFLHEFSHWLMAKLLGVPTGRFSLIPQAQPDGRLRLGYVETASGGWLRDALIGAAPLLTGSLFVAFAAIDRMGLLPLWDDLRFAAWNRFWAALALVPSRPDFWLWFYLTFTVSSTMLPSASDRRAWLPVGLSVAALLGLAILAGAGDWMLTHLAPLVNRFFQALALVFGLSAGLHLLLIVPVWLIHRALTRLTGLEVR
ncbi:MAG: hypothetical protein N2049_10050 [Anaerolineales bacterium]|nr:hypothetical protein [Anaerolineales bacterium]